MLQTARPQPAQTALRIAQPRRGRALAPLDAIGDRFHRLLARMDAVHGEPLLELPAFIPQPRVLASQRAVDPLDVGAGCAFPARG